MTFFGGLNYLFKWWGFTW